MSNVTFDPKIWIVRAMKGKINLENQIAYWEYKLDFCRKMGWEIKANQHLEKLVNLKLAIQRIHDLNDKLHSSRQKAEMIEGN